MYQKQTTDKTYNVAIYCRLSRDDGNDSVSSSIQNQRETLTKYCKERSWNIYDVYIDDGYSGTNFERPSFKRMITDITYGRVNCVITKDLSRLGRNYLWVGYYQEEFFPDNNVRYIAINDNYDSIDENRDMLGPFKNIINEYYAKDISKKIKFTLRSKAERGEARKSTIPLYGYMYADDGSRIPDPETAPVVKKIFDYYLEYKTLTMVVKKLKEEKIYCPGYYLYYKYNHNGQKYHNCPEEKKYEWRTSYVRTITKSPEYLGTYITQKSYKNSFKVKKKQVNKNPYVFEGKYEALVTKEVFDKAQRIRIINTSLKEASEENTYKKLCYCSNCGKQLAFGKRQDRHTDASKYRYFCRNTACNNRSYINRSALDELIRNELEFLFDEVLNNEKEFIKYAKKLNMNSVTSNNSFVIKEQKRLLDLKENYKEQLSRAKELYINGDFGIEDYNEFKNNVFKKMEAANDELSKLKLDEVEERDYEQEAYRLLDLLKELKQYDVLDQEVFETLIDKIVVSTEKTPGGYAIGASIDIYYPKINDILGGFLNEASTTE